MVPTCTPARRQRLRNHGHDDRRGVFDAFGEGDIAEVDFDAAIVRNVTSGKTLAAV